MSDARFIKTCQAYSSFDSPHLTCFESRFELSKYSDDLFSKFNIKIPKALDRAVAKRKAEYLAGRVCCQKALQLLASAETHVGVGNNRQPVFPPGFVGSVAHTNCNAIVVVARNSDYLGVGVDREKLLSEEFITAIEDQVLTAADREYLAISSMDKQTLLTIMYSAKESFFKAAYNQVQKYFGFESVDFIDFNQETNSFQLRLKESLSELLPIDQTIEGEIKLENQEIITFIGLAK